MINSEADKLGLREGDQVKLIGARLMALGHIEYHTLF